MQRKINLILGLFFLGVGILGAILPVLPSTCFFITAAYYFGTSSGKLENWMLGHPRIGPVIISWRTYKAIPKLGKIMACAAMSVSAILIFIATMPVLVKVGCILALVASAIYVVTRPTLENLVESSSVSIKK